MEKLNINAFLQSFKQANFCHNMFTPFSQMQKKKYLIMIRNLEQVTRLNNKMLLRSVYTRIDVYIYILFLSHFCIRFYRLRFKPVHERVRVHYQVLILMFSLMSTFPHVLNICIYI